MRVAATAFVAVLAVAAPAAGQSPEDEEAPFRLEQNVPNPFTPGYTATIIAYRLDRQVPVRLTVYNLLAQEVVVLVDRVEGPGRYVVSWDGLDANGEPAPAGIYWYKLQAGERAVLKQMRVLDPGRAPPEREPGPTTLAPPISGSRTASARSSRT